MGSASFLSLCPLDSASHKFPMMAFLVNGTVSGMNYSPLMKGHTCDLDLEGGRQHAFDPDHEAGRHTFHLGHTFCQKPV